MHTQQSKRGGDFLSSAAQDRVLKALDESRIQELAIINSTQDFIWTVDPEEFGLVIWNVALRDYFSQRLGIELTTGLSPEELLPPDYAQQWRRFYIRTLREGSFSTEYEVVARTNVLLLSFNVLKSGDHVFGISVFGKDITSQRQTEDSLRSLSSRLIQSQEEERARVAKELHDGIGQEVALLAIELDMAAKTPPTGSDQFTAFMEKLSARLKQLSNDLHRLSHGLHPALLENLGLVTALASFCREVSNRSHIAIEFKSRDVPRDLPKDVALCLYRFAQEGIQNVVKHSGAKLATVEVTVADDEIQVRIVDDGRGFNLSSRLTSASIGLVGMRERIGLAGGKLTVATNPGQGTTLDARVRLK